MKVRTHLKSGMGLGDCVAKIAHALGLNQLAEKYEEVSGKPCGCKQRQEMLNKAVPDVPLT
jgi:hypothetical protein